MVDGAEWIDVASGQPHPGAPLGMLLSAHAAVTPDNPAVTISRRTWSFAEFEQAANLRARDLLSRGVGKGDRVVLAMANCAEYLQCAFALWKIGATPCPVSHRLAPNEFTAIIDLAQPKRVIGRSDIVADALLLYDIDRPLEGRLSAKALEAEIAIPGKIANSGGSTGRPKLIIDPMPSVWGPDKEGCRRSPRLTLLNPGPLYHSAPFNTTTMALAQGTHVVCMERFDAVEWLDLVASHRINYAYMVPTMMARVAKLPADRTAAADLSSINTLLHMAAPCPADIKRWWIDRIGAAHLWEVYGGTERIGVTTICGTEWLEHPGSVGRAAPGQQIVITSPDGGELAPGEIGEIRFRKHRSAGTSYSYIGSQSRIDRDTDSFGDMGWVDSDGYLYVADRRTDMILVGGVNIYPAEIEAVMESLAGVRSCAVIGLPDADMGNRLHAIVELCAEGDRPDEQILLAQANSRLTGLKRLRSVEYTLDPLRDEAGKVRRSALRAARIA